MATAELQSSLESFVKFARSLKGDEKSEAQLFLARYPALRRRAGQSHPHVAKELELREADRLGTSEGLFFQEKPLPLDNLDANIRCADALFTAWPRADAIIGNPPYLGAKLLKPSYGADYVNRLRKAWPQVPGMADFCVYWRLLVSQSPRATRCGRAGRTRRHAEHPEQPIAHWRARSPRGKRRRHHRSHLQPGLER